MQLAIIFIILIILLIYQYYTEYKDLKSGISKQGNHFYVLDKPDSKKATELLQELTRDALKLIKHLQKEYPNHQGVQRLAKRFNPKTVQEGNPNDKDFTYTENKGQKMVICLRNKQMKFHRKNLILFPMIHELAHLCHKDYDNNHGNDFKKCFKFFLKEAKKIGIYQHIDFINQPKDYCGLTINTLP